MSQNLGSGYTEIAGIPVFVEPLAFGPDAERDWYAMPVANGQGVQIIVKSTGALVDLVDWCNERKKED